MKKYIYDANTYDFLGVIDDIPKCGEDFCYSCGDCLACYWEDNCYERESGEHFWVEYVDNAQGTVVV